MISIHNSQYKKLCVSSIYTFPKETSDKDINKVIIHDVVLGLYGLMKEYKEDLGISNVNMSMFNTFKYIWNVDDTSSEWKCICENNTKEELIDLILSEIDDESISRETINNLFPEDRLISFYIFKNDKLNDSYIFATYNILGY